MLKKLALSLAMGAALAMPAAASAQQLYSAHDLLEVLEAAQSIGTGSLPRDSTGDPKIDGKTEEINYSIMFYGCQNGRACTDIQFVASWDPGSVTIEKLNNWHREHRFGKAYLTETSAVITLNANLDFGVSKENLRDHFNWWRKVAKEYREDVILAK